MDDGQVQASLPQLEKIENQLVDAPVAVISADVAVGVKRKRGRPPKSTSAAKQLTPSPAATKNNYNNSNSTDEEDVCFICFDGGDLVLCDRRGCPKAYHPACIKRDEAFFKSKAKWNCGWHLCSNCEKASHYMCYTCTYSLCKGCAGKADFLCVRGNKGFCPTCMRTIMLIENPEQGNKDMVQVDFDDKSSWEYLFKVYWVYLKTKISLTLDELKKAKNPGEVVGLMVGKGKTRDALYDPNDDKGADSDGFSGYPEVDTSKRKKTNRWTKFPDKEAFPLVQKTSNEIVASLPKGAEWASKELLEFVAHMKNGDTSVLSQFDVQALLLEYIKRNNLRDPHRKSQIICDSRLGNMFGKARVGHFEMLKLLEYHFLIKVDSHADNVVQGGFIGAIAGQVETDEVNGSMLAGKDKRRKTRRKGNDRGPQTNLDEYAAINVHNITLIFLRRNLLENLIQDTDKFHDKVVGSVVRIKIPNNDQKQDMYRLVQVVGTSKVEVPYKIGNKMADCKLEVLNLNKKEVVSIDEISNQDFSEDECKRLRQCIKCGLAKRFSVGEILEKAMTLQAVKVNDLIEAEILRLNHLRDRASEKGHRKELRECVEKLQLLNMPEERQRRQHEVPEVHADPNMDPSHESDEDAGESYQKKQGDNIVAEHSGPRKRGRKPNSLLRGGEIPNNPKQRPRKQISTSLDQNKNTLTTARVHEAANVFLRSQGRDAYGSNEKPRNLYNPAGLASTAWNNPAEIMSHSVGMMPSSSDNEIEKIWHYQDPSGKIQGPFNMLQLRKWSTSGYFPPDLRIWKINERQDDSLLLTDAMDGLYHKKQQFNSNDKSTQSNGSNEFVKSSCSSSWSTPADANSRDGLTGKFSQGWDSGGHDSLSHHSQIYSTLSSATFSEKPCETTSHRGREAYDGEKRHSVKSHEQNLNGNGTPVFQSSSNSYHKSSDAPSSRQDLNNQAVNCSVSSGSFTSSIISAAMILSEMPGQNLEVDYSNLPSPTPKLSNKDLIAQKAENTHSVPSNVPGTVLSRSSPSHVSGRAQFSDPPSPALKPSSNDINNQKTENQLSDSSDVPLVNSGPSQSSLGLQGDEEKLPIPAPKPSNEDVKVQTAENNEVMSSNAPLPNSEPCISGGASLLNGAQLPGVTSEWGGHSPTPNHVEEWDSSPIPGSLLKPADLITDLTVPSPPPPDQLALSSSAGLPSHASSWHAIVSGANEFPLAEESVSDLLAEVDAMESLNGPASPTSAMNCSLEFTHDIKDDGFSADEALSPPPNPVKSDAFSSTGDVQLPSQSFTKNEPSSQLQANVIDPQKMDVNHSPTGIEFEEEKNPSNASVNQWEADSIREPPIPATTSSWSMPETEKDASRNAGPQEADSTREPPIPSTASWNTEPEKHSSQNAGPQEADSTRKPSIPSTTSWNMPEPEIGTSRNAGPQEADSTREPPTPSTTSWNMPEHEKDTSRNAGPHTRDTGWGKMQGNGEPGWGGQAQVNNNMSWIYNRGAASPNLNWSISPGNQVMWGNQPKFSENRFSGPRDRNFHGGHSGFSRDRSSWNRQSSFGSGGGGGGGGNSSSRPLPKGQRVCKFYESGRCKKGASCSYLHP